MKYFLVLIGCSAALAAFVQPVSAKSVAEIEQIARSVSVEMISGIGSGVLVHRQGNLYTIVTNRHVVCEENKFCDESKVLSSYQLKTIDGQVYQVGRSAIKLLKDARGNKLDLAIVQFRSSRNYVVAQVAEPGSLKVADAVYTAGFPQGQEFLFGQGKALAVVHKRLEGDRGGYTVIYDAETLPGMSGGGAFSSEGRLVAIHGQGDKFTENTQAGSNYATAKVRSKIGYNRGIPIRWVVRGLDGMGKLSAVQEEAVAATTADEFFIAGFNKFVDPGENASEVRRGREDAVRLLSRAIDLNSKYAVAYFTRAVVNGLLSNYSAALADYNQVISLYPTLANAYSNRGLLKADKLNDPQGALADCNQAITLNPKEAVFYRNRGLLKADKLNDPQGALADYNQAIALNPKEVALYYIRGNLKHTKLNDPQGALTDYNQAIIINPKEAFLYYICGNLKEEKLNDPQGALTNYNQAIALNPKEADFYYIRGNLKQEKLNDHQGALTDYNQAVALKPKEAVFYYHRGLLKHTKLNDPQGSLSDYNQAIALNPKEAVFYYNRGNLHKNQLNNPQRALADYNQAISINPKYVQAYTNRGNLKQEKLNDFQGALVDYNQAIALDSKDPNPYYNRGALKNNELNDRPGAIADFRVAARLYRSQGNTAKAQQILDVLRQLGVQEKN
jgi:tetratricopeptide (TPR) repeat protein/V8-like Glu-specific endopeptidase